MTKNIITTMVLLLSAGSFYSCKKESGVDDPAKAIIGKWECVAIQTNRHTPGTLTQIPFQPNGYYEFRADGTAVWYDYALKKHTAVIRYWFEIVENVLRIRYSLESSSVDMHRHLDLFTGHENRCIFFSKNQMGWITPQDPGSDYITTYIYQRKK